MAGLIVILFALFAAGVPIAFALGLAPMGILLDLRIPLIVIPQAVFESLDSFALLALPLFVLAGRLMQYGGVAERLVALAVALVGWMPGALAAAVVLTSMFFATLSGSSAATSAAIGGMLIPEMVKQKYPRPFSAATTAAAGELGVIIPPSMPAIIYGVITGVSISDLFKAGVFSGLLLGGLMIVTAVVLSWLRGYGEHQKFVATAWLLAVWEALRRGALSLLLPFIILGGIFGGYFTPTEAAAVAVVCVIILSVFIYQRIRLRDLLGHFAAAAMTSAVVMIIVGFAALFGYTLTLIGAPQKVSAAITAFADSPVVFLLLANILLLLVGMFMETFAAIIILAPILAPTAVAFGIDPVHFGMIMLVNLAIGLITPPVGVNLFIASTIAQIKLEQILKPLGIYLVVIIFGLMLITYIPSISLALVR